MSLRARHPSAVQKARDQGETELRRHLQLNPEEYERIRTNKDPATLAEAADHFLPVRTANFGLSVLQAAIVDPKVGARIFAARWSVISFSFDKEPRTLLTSDRPCQLEGNLMIPGRFVMALPLNPTNLFIACDSLATERRVRELASDVLLDRVNKVTIASSAQYVYGVDDRYVPLIEDILRAA
jgi:hypothetical protein